MKAAIKLTIILCTTLLLSSCGKSLSEKVSIVGVENLKVMGLSGVKSDIVFRNESFRKIKLLSVSAVLKESDKDIATLTLTDEITIPRRTESIAIPTAWRFSDVNAMAAFAASKHIFGGGDGKGLRLDVEAVVKVGLIKRRVERTNLSVADMLRELDMK